MKSTCTMHYGQAKRMKGDGVVLCKDQEAVVTKSNLIVHACTSRQMERYDEVYLWY